ncbi:thiamine-phosphate kinase [Aestuariibacter sp. AA17]|uniref:Thiamine-monophosphate kinase n=1 Tax=Fluctibacter corallii TaxID=2984329 RepID=A0ABT3A3F5_9ALTE|nr:thiamine-phosphate kinase [Aestuariibacter sp. AA17]MCV2883218.1 thiamine-phosphate kinase [Aestuariibacter sp. AA17]
MKEFAIIDHFFKSRSHQRKDVVIGIGDDCAVTDIPDGQSLAITTDTLVGDVHFFKDANPAAIAHKAVAVNLSDLASMGAEPAWLSLSLSLPNADEEWLETFSQSLAEITDYYAVQLIGGDTVQGPLSITITAHGFVPQGQALTRSGAKPGHLVYVTGTLGDAGAGLDIMRGKLSTSKTSEDFLVKRLHYPTARLLAGTALRRIASACVDVSDGLLSDLGHILESSQCGATIDIGKLPLSVALKEAVGHDDAIRYALDSGDDYELIFTVPEELKGNLDIALANFNIKATCIGQLTGANSKLEMKRDGEPCDEAFFAAKKGFEHFS